MDGNDASHDRKKDDGRNPFEKFVEAVNGRVSRAPFFFVILFIVLAWAVSAPFWPDLKQWQVAIHTFASVVSILLLVLLENSGRRSTEAAQEKLNVLAEALADLMESQTDGDEELEKATTKLRQAINLEDRH